MIINNNNENILMPRLARFIVGTSTAGWTANDCDYLCDGTDDQVEINAAIQALPSTGGEVVILDGTYNLTDSILVNKNKVTLSGNGQNTILKRVFQSINEDHSLIYVTSSYNTIKFLSFYRNRGIYGSYLEKHILLKSSENNIIIGNTISGGANGIHLISSNNNTITENVFDSNDYCIYLKSSIGNVIEGNNCRDKTSNSSIYLVVSSNNTIIGNVCGGGNCIDLKNSSQNNSIIGNTCAPRSYGIVIQSSGGNSVIGNTCNHMTDSTASRGICLLSSVNNTIANNTCFNNNDDGISIIDSSQNNIITGNICTRGAGTVSDYTSSQYTIHLENNSNNNLITSNNIMGKNYTEENCTGNTFANNKYE